MAEFFNEPARSWDVLAQQHDRLDDRIASLTDADLTTRPLESIADELTNRYSLNIPVLHEDAATARSEEIVFDPMRSPTRRFIAGRPALTRGLRITVSVPYTGDRRILELRPDTYESIAPVGELTDTAIVFIAEGAKLDPDLVRADYEAWLGLVRRNLELHRQKLGAFNQSLRPTIVTALEERVATLREHQEVVTRLGLPIAA